MVLKYLNSCHSNRAIQDQSVLGKICFDSICIYYNSSPKKRSNEFCFVFVDGRDREINSYEDFGAFLSLDPNSEYIYKKYAFVRNPDNFLFNDSKLINDLNIEVRRIETLSSLEEYSRFCCEKLYHMLPEQSKHVVTFQPDGFLMKKGWENFYSSVGSPYLSAHWRHNASIAKRISGGTTLWNGKTTNVGNGAFSCRDAEVMRKISKDYYSGGLFEVGREDFRIPMEDLFFSFFSFCVLGYTPPSLESCDLWAQDPLELDDFIKKKSYGFHYPKMKSEWSPCQH